MKKYKVSIITVVYNVSRTIIPTLESIRNIKTDDVEYIVIDGESTDDTLSILEKFSDIIDILVSEPDKGIYDAMNKGISLSHGDWLNFQNCGDRLLCIPWIELDALSLDYSALCGCIQDENECVIKPRFGTMLYYGNTLPHQALFYRKNDMLFFDIKYKVFADYNLNIKMFKNKCNIKLVNDIIAIHALDGISMNKKYVKEIYQILWHEFGLYRAIRLFIYWRLSGFIRKLKKI